MCEKAFDAKSIEVIKYCIDTAMKLNFPKSVVFYDKDLIEDEALLKSNYEEGLPIGMNVKGTGIQNAVVRIEKDSSIDSFIESAEKLHAFIVKSINH
jgi:hypothetical protein